MADQSRPGDGHGELLVRYLAGDATEAERVEVERWAAASSDHNLELAVLRRLWDEAGALPSAERVNSMWLTLRHQMHAPGEAGEAPRPQAVTPDRPAEVAVPSSARAPRRERAGRPGRLRWGAAVAMMAAALAGVWIARSETLPGRQPAVELAREVRTHRGERMQLQLVDGTQVTLGPQSTLSIRYLVRGPREMELAGEAIFDVAHDVDRPFRVRSGDALTEDLGTRFSIRAYPTEDDVHVAVAEGVVTLRSAIAPGDSTAVLRVGQVGRLTADGEIDVTSGVDTGAYFGWAYDRLDYRQVPLRQVADDLERRFNVSIAIPDESVAARRITLRIRARSVVDALDAVAAPLRLRYERQGDTILIRS